MFSEQVISLVFMFVVLMDPLGNLPIFVAMLKNRTPGEYRHIIIRESAFALAGMLIAFLLGRFIMQALHMTSARLGIAGGLILLLIGIRMIFYTLKPEAEQEEEKEPYIVPLAIPLICGPGLIAMLVTASQPKMQVMAALFPAWLIQMVILLFGKKVSALLGRKILDAFEALVGLLLTGIATGMIIDNLKIEFFR